MLNPKLCWGPVLVALFSMGTVSSASAQSSDTNSTPFQWSDVHVSVAQRLWYASFNSTLYSLRAVVPPGSTTPVLQSQISSYTSSKWMPITALSASWKDWGLSVSGSPHTSFSNPDATGGSVSRDEFDISASYALLKSQSTTSRLSVLLDYKSGQIKPVTDASTSQFLGAQGTSKLAGWLIGFSGIAPLGSNDLLMYGNVALGTGHSRSAVVPSINLIYQIAEVGVSYPLGERFSLQFGYRAQNFTLRNVALQTLSASNPAIVLATDHRTVQVTTQGLILGVTASF